MGQAEIMAHPFRSAFLRWMSPEALQHVPPLWREGRWLTELFALRRDPIYGGASLPEGGGRPVLLIPGYLAGDRSLGLLAQWLRKGGYHPVRAGLRLNAGCIGPLYLGLEQRLEARVRDLGQRALIIGQSRGGLLARLLAGRRPDLVSGLITLGAPLRDPLGVHPLVLLNVGMVGLLGSLGVPGLLSASCLRRDRCCGDTWQEVKRPLSPGLPFLSIYSRSDGIVDWRTCLDPAARHVAVDTSHIGMAVSPAVYRAIAQELRTAPP